MGFCMKKIKFFTNLLAITFGLMAFCTNAQQYTQETLENNFPKEIKNDINSVQSLMRLETLQALGNQEQKQIDKNINESVRYSTNNQLPNDSNEYAQLPLLKSIYGVGNRLRAKVSYKQHNYIYKKGQQNPVGIKKGIKNVLLMTDFTDLCITLVGGNNTYELCLNN